MKNNTKHKNNTKQSNEPLAFIKSGVVGLYNIFMLAVFVLYAPEKYFFIGNHKIAFFEKVTGAFLIISLILFLLSLFNSLISKEKIILNLSLPEIILLLYGGWNLVSFTFSFYRRGALFGYDGWRTGLFMQLCVIAVFFAVKRWSTKKDLFIKIAVSVLIAECLMVVLQRLGFDPFRFHSEFDYMEWNRRNLLGTIGNSNWLMGYEIIIIPLLVWLYLQAEKVYERIIWGIGNFIMISALFLQDSSSGIVAFSAILLFLVWIYAKDPAKLARVLEIVCMIFLFWSILSIFHIKLLEPIEKDTTKYYSLLWLIPTSLLGAIIALLYIFIKKKGESLPKSFAVSMRVGMIAVFLLLCGGVIAIQFSDTLWAALGSKQSLRISDTSGSSRILLWKQCLKYYLFETELKDFILGFGPDSFGYWYATKNIVIPSVGNPFVGGIYTNAHNDFLTTTVNLGIPGIIIYFCVFLSMAVNAGSAFFKKKEYTYAVLMLMVIIGYVVNNMFSFQTVCSTPLFFIIAGLLLPESENN